MKLRKDGEEIVHWNLTVGVIVTIVCLVIECVVVAGMFRILFSLRVRRLVKPTFPRMASILIVSLVVLFCGNLMQAAIWALVFEWLGEFQNYSQAFYHSMVNFTTLGYGDLIMSDDHKLLGAIEAANGVLMFGLTTGLLCSVLNVFIQHSWNEKLAETGLI